jgi:hypothetical protein
MLKESLKACTATRWLRYLKGDLVISDVWNDILVAVGGRSSCGHPGAACFVVDNAG